MQLFVISNREKFNNPSQLNWTIIRIILYLYLNSIHYLKNWTRREFSDVLAKHSLNMKLDYKLSIKEFGPPAVKLPAPQRMNPNHQINPHVHHKYRNLLYLSEDELTEFSWDCRGPVSVNGPWDEMSVFRCVVSEMFGQTARPVYKNTSVDAA